jgi:hypothetical protein
MRSIGALKVVIATCALALIAPHFSPATAAPAAQLVTCVDLSSGKERISKTGTCRTTEAMAKWRLAPVDSAFASGSTTKTLTVCSNKESSPFTYQLIRSKCAKHMQSGLYTRSSALPAKPVIVQVSANSYESASLALASDPGANLDAPIVYYTITSSKGDVKKVNSWRDLNVTVFGLRSSTSYTFTITATNVDGTSPVSASSLPVTTQTYVAPVTTAPLAAPAFALSANAETRTVGTAATGFTIASSTGGTIAGFGISATPAGMSFSAATGALTGTPTSIQSATTYTITATNAAGSATRTFTLTVSAVVYTVGSTGPGGGKIFYVANTPFACGPTRAVSCTYLEAAPALWNGGAGDPLRRWAEPSQNYTAVNNGSSPETATAKAIGWGYRNTRAIILQGNTDIAMTAAALVDAYTVTIGGVVVSDWYLPAIDELDLMYPQRASIGGLQASDYWSSTEGNPGGGWYLEMGTGNNASNRDKGSENNVRPIRAF